MINMYLKDVVAGGYVVSDTLFIILIFLPATIFATINS